MRCNGIERKQTVKGKDTHHIRKGHAQKQQECGNTAKKKNEERMFTSYVSNQLECDCM